MIEQLLARVRIQETEDAVRKAEWLRWWSSKPTEATKGRGL